MALKERIDFSVLDTTDLTKIDTYEFAMYRAFADTEIKTLDSIWEFDHKNNKLKTKIPYTSQKIFMASIKGEILGGTAINGNCSAPFQLETFGFEIDKDEPGICEGVAVFNLKVFVDRQPIALLLRDYTFGKLKEMNRSKIYGTCSKQKLRGYEALGFSCIEETLFKGEQKFLLVRPV